MKAAVQFITATLPTDKLLMQVTPARAFIRAIIRHLMMWSGLKCSAGSWAASLSWTMTLQFGNESRGKHFLTPEKKNTNPTNVSHSGFVWTQFWWKVEDLVGINEWGLARVFSGMYMCAYACVCTLLGKWACQYAAQASLWWQADDSAVIGLISLRTWGEIWRLP